MNSLSRFLALWSGGFAFAGTLLVGLPLVRAQFGKEEVAPATSPEQAARRFAQLVAQRGYNFSLLTATVSHKDQDTFGDYKLTRLLQALDNDAKLTRFDASSAQHTSNGVIVKVRPAAKAASLPVVCVREDGAWRVSVLRTFAKVRGLGEGKLQSAVFDLTGVALPGLPNADQPHMKERICESHLKELGLGMAQYLEDYDERYPRAGKWTDEVRPYVRNEQLFSCPSIKGHGGYAFNAHFSRVFQWQLRQADFQIPLLYETSQRGFNAMGTGVDLERRHSSNVNPKPQERLSVYVLPNGRVLSETINNPTRTAPNFVPRLWPMPTPQPDLYVGPPPPASR